MARGRSNEGPEPLLSLLSWLTETASHARTTSALLRALIAEMHDRGLPLARMSCGFQTRHPQASMISYHWERGQFMPEERILGHDLHSSRAFVDSPIGALDRSGGVIRRRLCDPDTDIDFPILRELRDKGLTDYIALRLPVGQPALCAITWATDRPGGFTDREIDFFRALNPLIGLVLESRVWRRITRHILDTYLGRDVGHQVLEGSVRRGDGESIRAVIWYSDMNGFTELSDRLNTRDLLSVLNQCLEHQIAAIHHFGGEVLKFMGDGLLAIFRIDDSSSGWVDSVSEVCFAAMRAAELCFSRLAGYNAHRRVCGLDEVAIRLALHAGRVEFVNIGAPDRLDFTVIGPAVNLSSRLETLAKKLGHDLVVSEAFVRSWGGDWPWQPRPLGAHAIRGVRRPEQLFTVRFQPESHCQVPSLVEHRQVVVNSGKQAA
ncbi:MAG: adenylate/guanylate cyclase domain-containing protein [Myxococcota bacterium]